MDHNPFYDAAKADAHTPHDVASLFVPDASPIWGDLQYPINHLVVGARGTGKTMALRQLDYLTLANGDQNPRFRWRLHPCVPNLGHLPRSVRRSRTEPRPIPSSAVPAGLRGLPCARNRARPLRPSGRGRSAGPAGLHHGVSPSRRVRCRRRRRQLCAPADSGRVQHSVLADLGSMCMAAARRSSDHRRTACEGPAARQFVA